MDTNEIREFFKNDIYAMETTGIEILDVAPDYAKCKLHVTRKHLNADGTCMGGCIYTLADFTFALAANASVAPTNTMSSHIVFNSPAKGEYLFAETEVIKDGRTVATYMVKVTDENSRLIATCTMMGFRRG